MPRDGSGHGDNAVELDPAFGHNISHGAGGEAATDNVDRSGKAAPMPELEKGEALEGMNASGAGSSGIGGGQGKHAALEPQADVEAAKRS